MINAADPTEAPTMSHGPEFAAELAAVAAEGPVLVEVEVGEAEVETELLGALLDISVGVAEGRLLGSLKGELEEGALVRATVCKVGVVVGEGLGVSVLGVALGVAELGVSVLGVVVGSCV
jgi:hypothetical protein